MTRTSDKLSRKEINFIFFINIYFFKVEYEKMTHLVHKSIVMFLRIVKVNDELFYNWIKKIEINAKTFFDFNLTSKNRHE